MKLIFSVEKNGFGIITLSNPPYNVLTSPVFEDRRKLNQFFSKKEIKGVIIKGEGRHFCGGADLKTLADQIKEEKRFTKLLDEGKALLDIIRHATIPVVAVIKGNCLGAGMEIALACHFRFASRNAILGFPETDHGLIPGFSGTITLNNVVNRQTAIELIVSGKLINGEEAKSLGIVDEYAPSNQIEQKAIKFLESMTKNRPTKLIRSAMTSIHNSSKMSEEKAIREETKLFINIAKEMLNK